MAAFVCVELLDFGDSKHTILDMPTVSRQARFAVLAPQDIICAINLQHDCSRGHCTHDNPKDVYQEREKTTRQKMTIAHSDDTHFILNTQSLHNYRALSELIPHHLKGYSYRVANEPQLRRQAAESIRQRQKSQMHAKEDLLISQIADRADGSSSEGMSSANLLQSLQTNGDLVDVIEGVLQRSGGLLAGDEPETELDPTDPGPSLINMGEAPADSEQPTIQQNSTSVPAAPVFSTATKSKSQGKRKAAAAPSKL